MESSTSRLDINPMRFDGRGVEHLLLRPMINLKAARFCVRPWQTVVFPQGDRKFLISALMQSTAENADCCIQCKSALIKLLYNCNLQLQSHTQSQTLVSGTCLVRNDYRVVNYKLSIRSPGYKLRINNSTNNLSNMTRQKWAVVVVTSDSRGLRFKSSRRQTVLKRRK